MAIHNAHDEALTCGCVILVRDRDGTHVGAHSLLCAEGRSLMQALVRSPSRNARECGERDVLYAHFATNRKN
jgi:hypothetical protein